MSKCVFCGNDIEDDFVCESANGNEYTDIDFCRACREVLKIVDRRCWKKKKVEVRKSDYFLPGFVFSKEKGCFVRGERKSILS